MNKEGRISIFIVIIIAIIVLLLRFGVEQVINMNINHNEVNALATLRAISTALENYASANRGIYPTDESVLVYPNPSYLRTAYNGKTIGGYSYRLTLSNTGYDIIAIPIWCGISGNKIYKITTGGVLNEADCSSS